MATKRWIKLYTEIITDRKMVRLPDSAWRLCIELFLMADECGTGELPDRDEIAWQLRKDDIEQVNKDIDALIKAGILTEENGAPFVVRFQERQAQDDSATKSARYYRRKRDLDATQRDPNATQRDLDPTQRDPNATERDEREEKRRDSEEIKKREDSESIVSVVSFYKSNIGNVTDAVRIELENLCMAHSSKAVMEAIKTAKVRKKKHVRYVTGILKNWQNEGYPASISDDDGDGGSPKLPVADPEWRSRYRQQRAEKIAAAQAMRSNGDGHK